MRRILKTRWRVVRIVRPNIQNQSTRYTWLHSSCCNDINLSDTVVVVIILIISDLLIDNIERENTETVEPLFPSTCTNRVQSTARVQTTGEYRVSQ